MAEAKVWQTVHPNRRGCPSPVWVPAPGSDQRIERWENGRRVLYFPEGSWGCPSHPVVEGRTELHHILKEAAK